MSASQQVMGTPHYFSPEQARGQPVDGRTDLYSLGVLLFRASTGTLPFEGDDWYAVARQHIETPAPTVRSLVPELTEDFESIVSRLLEKEPEERFRSATMLIDALAQLPTAPERTERRPGSGSADATLIAPAPMSAAFRRQRGLWKRGGVAVSIAAVAAILYLIQQSQTDASPGPGQTVGTTPIATSPFGDTAQKVEPIDLSNATGFSPPDNMRGSPRTGDSAVSRSGSAGAIRGARITVITDTAASVYVDDRLAERGKEISVSTNQPVKIRALFRDAMPECQTALRDSTVRLRDGDRREIRLVVRPCGSVVFATDPRHALITLVSMVDGTRIVVRADTIDALLLPVGRYAYSATADGYWPFSGDTLTIAKSTTPARKRIPLDKR
jgi:serine/threonine-protein kinase